MAIGALARAGRDLAVWVACLALHRRGGVAARLHPQSVDLVPRMGRDDLGKLGARYCLAPHAVGFGSNLDVGMLATELPSGLVAQRVNRGAADTRDHHDVAFAIELFDEPFRGNPAPFILIYVDVVGAGLVDDAVVSDDHDALLASGLDRLV